MDAASSTEELNVVVDNPCYLSIINSCGWPITKPITLTSKIEFIHRLVYHEVIGKRLSAISSFKKGLAILNLEKLLRENYEEMKPFFVYCTTSTLTADCIIRLIEWGEVNESSRQSKNFFIQYLEEKDGKLANILHNIIMAIKLLS